MVSDKVSGQNRISLRRTYCFYIDRGGLSVTIVSIMVYIVIPQPPGEGGGICQLTRHSGRYGQCGGPSVPSR